MPLGKAADGRRGAPWGMDDTAACLAARWTGETREKAAVSTSRCGTAALPSCAEQRGATAGRRVVVVKQRVSA